MLMESSFAISTGTEVPSVYKLKVNVEFEIFLDLFFKSGKSFALTAFKWLIKALYMLVTTKFLIAPYIL